MTSLSGDVQEHPGRGAGDAADLTPAGDAADLSPAGHAAGDPAADDPAADDPAAGGPDGTGRPAGGLTVTQLAERSGVGVPSIHHYRRLGLLPPPVPVAANRFRYDERHVEALQAIRLLRERRGLSLAAIREVLPDVLSASDQQAFRPEMWDAVLAISEMADGDHDEVRTRLLAAARSAFVARGYAGVNVEQLCQRAGIAKGSFYRYFASKEAVYVAAARSVADEVALSVGRWRRPLDAASAGAAVAGALRPFLPLLLEVVVRTAHGDEGLDGVVPGVMAAIGDVVGPRLAPGDAHPAAGRSGSGAPDASCAEAAGGGAGRAVAEQALDALFRRAAGLA